MNKIFKTKQREILPWTKKLNPWWWFLNEDDPEPLEWHEPESSEWYRYITWYLRNPFHNFTWYVIGVADKDHYIYGKLIADVFDKKGGWNYLFHYMGYGIIYLPFISYMGSFKFYIGWREKGNFGFKLSNNKDWI
jgi:hypothetical protein